jgi:hypothetical protein
MKRVLLILVLSNFLIGYVTSQEDTIKYYIDIDFEYTGRIVNQSDSVFQVYYFLSLVDIQYDIVKILIQGGDTISTNEILQGHLQSFVRLYDKIRIDMGEFKYGDKLKWIRFYDTEGSEHRVIYNASFGELEESSFN